MILQMMDNIVYIDHNPRYEVERKGDEVSVYQHPRNTFRQAEFFKYRIDREHPFGVELLECEYIAPLRLRLVLDYIMTVPWNMRVFHIMEHEAWVTHFNKEAVRSWIDALRSGGYEELRGALKKGDRSFSLIGLLCRVSTPEQYEEDVYIPTDMEGHHLSEYLSQKVGVDYRLIDEAIFAYVNGCSFSDIATMFEERVFPAHKSLGV